jgi:hypothetical protein
MTYTEITLNAAAKAHRASTVAECEAAIMDCHDTLQVNQPDFRSDYAIKLWAEIDAYRDRSWALQRAPRVANDFGSNDYI